MTLSERGKAECEPATIMGRKKPCLTVMFVVMLLTESFRHEG